MIGKRLLQTMSPERLRQIEELYHSACERRVDQRDAFLQEACGTDSDLLRQVRALLAQDGASGPMEKPVLQVAARLLENGATALSPGTVLGPYRIERRLGAGGMGDVYKARDTRLGREVAIKTAKEEFSGRFQREAWAISALNHPHICTLYDVGPDFLVMEYISGTRIEGPMPAGEAVRLGIQIASAVRHAHQHGVIHRDLKPANILLTKSGVKVLDFGLAKLERAGEGGGELTATDTLTEQGTIMGTLRYIAPEQLKGKEADQRCDVFAFGVVLYEMLTGRAAFEAGSEAEVIASLLKAEPEPVGKLAPGVPVALAHLIETCLRKDPEERCQSIHDVLLQLEWIASQPGSEKTTVPTAKRFVWPLTAAVLGSAALGFAFLYFRHPPPRRDPVRFEQLVPPGVFMWGDMAEVAPDGRSFVYEIGRPGPHPVLWVRRMDQVQAKSLAGTDDATSPFWSPDSRFIGFFTHGQLKIVDAAGGTPQTLYDVQQLVGGTWNRDGVIVFGADNGPLRRISAAGGEPKPLLTLDTARGETSQAWPHFLPDGQHFLYTSQGGPRAGVYLASLDSKATSRVLDVVSNVNWVAPGLLLFARGRTLMAQPFDARTLRLSGTPLPVVDPVAKTIGPKAIFSSSPNGTLVYWPESAVAQELQLVWCDRSGRRLGSVGGAHRYRQGTLSPDEKWFAAQVNDPEGHHADIWLVDLVSGNLNRMTSGEASKDTVVWSPDGREILFSSGQNGPMNPYRMGVGRGEERLVYKSGDDVYPGQWLSDGSFLLLNSWGVSFFRLRPGAAMKLEPLLTNQYNKDEPRVSPDGHWVVYNTDESGRWEVYLASFPGFQNRRQISTNGGVQGYWRKDGKELFYLSQDGDLMSVAVKPGAPPEPGIPKVLFRTRIPVAAQLDQYAVAADGQRFLLLESLENQARPFTVVVDWPTAVQR
jgi:Tol biopolymer transport system component/tRNA A-37 threonylcarbamoyl transferase component Bud32